MHSKSAPEANFQSLRCYLKLIVSHVSDAKLDKFDQKFICAECN